MLLGFRRQSLPRRSDRADSLGLLSVADLTPLATLAADHTDYGALYQIKPQLLQQAYGQYQIKQPALPYGNFTAFCKKMRRGSMLTLTFTR